MKNSVRFAAFFSAVLVFAALNDVGRGDTVSWQGLGGGPNDSGSWESMTPSGWSNGFTPGPTDTAQLLDVTSGTRTITVDAPENIGDLLMQQNSAGVVNILTLNNNLTINAQDPDPITTTTGAGANPPVMNVNGNTFTVGTSYQGPATMSFGNVNLGTFGQLLVQNTASNGSGPPGNSFTSTFGAVTMPAESSIQFSSLDLLQTQTFAGPLSVTGAASISETATRFAGGSIAFDGGVSVTGDFSGLTVTAVGPVSFGTATTAGLSVAAGDSVTVSNPNGTASATVNGLSLGADPATLLTFTGLDAGNTTTPITVAGMVSLGAGSTLMLSYSNAQGSAVFNIASSATVVQDGATLDFDFGTGPNGWNNGIRKFVNNGNWTLQNGATVTMTQQGSPSTQEGFGNLQGNVNSGTMSVNSNSQVLFADMTNSGTLNLGAAAIGAVLPGWTSTLTNASGGVVNVTGTGALFVGGALPTSGGGSGGFSYVGQAGSQLNVPAGASLTFSYQNNASLSNSGTINQNGGTIDFDWNNSNNYGIGGSGFSNAGTWTLQNGAVFQSTKSGVLYWGGFGAGANNTNASGGTLSVLSGSSLLIGNLSNAGMLVFGTNATMGSGNPNVIYQNLTLDNSPGGVLNVAGSGVNLVGAPSAAVYLINEAGATMNFSNSSSLTMNFFTQQTAMFSNSGTVNQPAGSALVLNWNLTGNANNVTSGFTNAGTWMLNGAVIESTQNGVLYYGGFQAGANNTNASGGTLSVLSGSSLLIGNLVNAGTLVLGTNATMGSTDPGAQYQSLTLTNTSGGVLNITGSGVNLFAYQGTVQLTNAAGATINFSNGSSLTMNVSTGRSAMFSNSGTVNQVGSALLFNWNDMSNNSFDITNNWFVNSGTWTLTGASLVDFTREGTSGQAGGFNFGYACSNAGTMNIRDASIVNFATLSNTGTMNVGNAGSAVALGTTAQSPYPPTLNNGTNGVLNVQGNATLGWNDDSTNDTTTLNNGTNGSLGGQVNVGDATHVATFELIGGNALLTNGVGNSVTVAAGSSLGILSYENGTGNNNPFHARNAWLSNAGTVTLAGTIEFRPNHSAPSIGLINNGTGTTVISGAGATIVRSVPALGSQAFSDNDNANNAYDTVLSFNAPGTVLQGATANDTLTYANSTGSPLVNTLQVTMGGILSPGNGSGGNFLSSVGVLNLIDADVHLGSGTISSITVTNGGSGYTSAPNVNFPSLTSAGNGYGWGVAATAVLTGDAVTAVNVTNGGQYFATPPAITIAAANNGPGSGATATATIAPVANSGGTVNMDIGGMYADIGSFDQLNVGGGTGSGNFIIVNGSGATLNIIPVNGFTPTGAYKLITANNVVGTFDNIEFNGGSAAGIYTLSYTTTGVSAVFNATAPTWAAAGGNNWSIGGNWNSGSAPNGVDAQAVVGTGGSPIILDEPQTIGHLVFDNATTSYTISGTNALTLQVNSQTVAATVTTANGTHTVAVPVILASNARVDTVGSSSLEISGDISGSGYGITKDGSGTLVLSGTANSYSGGMYVEAGTLVVNNNGAIADGTSLTVGAGAASLFDPPAGGAALAVASPLHAAGVEAVPEPGTLALLAVAVVVAIGVRRRKV